MGELEKKKKEINLPIGWNFNSEGINALKLMNGALKRSGSHGVVSSIPIICQGKSCPFYDTCTMEALHIDVETLVGQRCPVEVSQIMKSFEEYVDHFEIDIDKADKVVLGLLKELINYEIQIERADKAMAVKGDFLEDVVVGVSADGRPIKNKEIAKALDYRDRANKKKQEILSLLNSTPKDKAGQKLNVTIDPSTYASNLIAKAEELREQGVIIDAEYRVDDKDE